MPLWADGCLLGLHPFAGMIRGFTAGYPMELDFIKKNPGFYPPRASPLQIETRALETIARASHSLIDHTPQNVCRLAAII
jgi:hypothetical protein